MNTLKTLIAVSSFALASSAFAGNVGAEPHNAPYPGADTEQPAPLPQPYTSGKSRAQVVAELRDAKAHGLVWSQDATAPVQQASVSGLTRAQVQVELRQAHEQGLISFGDLDYPPAS